MVEKLKNMKPLYIYLLGGVISMVSGLFLKPFSESAHTVIVIFSLCICIFAIYKHLR